MIYNLKMFTKAKELEKLTGLTHDELWGKGFNLDDMDFGFESDTKLHTSGEDEWFKNDKVWGINAFLDILNGYCVGSYYTEYGGKHYYTVHHS